MNRAERRKAGVKTPPPRMKHIREEVYQKAIDDAYARGFDNGVRSAFALASEKAVYFMLCLPLLVLKKHFNDIRLKQCNGVSREQHFFDLCLETYEQYDHGEDTLDKLMADTKEITGVDVAKKVDA